MVIDRLIDLLDTLPTKASKELEKQIEELIEEYAIENELCPKCIYPLEIQEWEEYRGECNGWPAYETLHEFICPKCGWKEGD